MSTYALVVPSRAGEAVFRCGERSLRIRFVNERIARVTLTQGKLFAEKQSRIVLAEPEAMTFAMVENAETYSLRTGALVVEVSKGSGALRYFDANGKLLMREPERGGKWLTPRPVVRNVFDRDTAVEVGQSIDGARAVATKYTAVFDREAFEAKLEFELADDEALFGLGSHEEGYANLRGRSRELYQQNMKAVVPHLVSTRGWGLLLDCCSLMTFHDDALGSYWWADCVDELDYYFIAGGSHDEVVREYRWLTGAVPLPPKWAFGFVQSKERYVTADEVVGAVAEYRRRGISLDCIVLDWKSWPNGAGWGQKSFDPLRFPDPAGFIGELHAMGARLMVSVWPIMTGGCENQMELLDRDLMLGNKATYNAFLSEARECYFAQAERGLLAHGVDAWWCDCTEPFEADWGGAVKPEPHRRLAVNTGESKLYLDDAQINEYSLAHSQGMYEGQRRASESKRVVNLTRSSYAGQSRYGTITWNGDVCATWETLRRSVAEGLNFCATGEPYWTVDAGGFFVANKPELWFWRGDYNAGTRGLTDMNALAPDPNDTGCTDRGFWELYVRWMQYAAFLPMFRSHGTDAAREIWRFGEPGTPFYDALAECIRLRYRLMPYVYSTAATVTFKGGSMMRALALAFPEDHATYDVADQFLFGEALMVCPVLRPMHFGAGSQPVEAERTREVYLPAGCAWYRFDDGEVFTGGQTITADAPLERMPVFAREGSIVAMTAVMQFADEVPDAPWELHVYTGGDAAFTMYEDRGDGYDYERDACAWIPVRWDEMRSELVIGAREGSFAEMVSERDVTVVFHAREQVRIAPHSLRYAGAACTVAMPRSGETA